MFTAATGDSQWLTQRVPFLLILHIGFSYYFARWIATTYSPAADKNRATESEGNEAYKDSE
ncbi:hypothetical protein Alg130_10186 [Pyrenophora tritici-repentis]|nr:hypothetical protein Alg130_10186 [Pyrenophora tritici-repentis]